MDRVFALQTLSLTLFFFNPKFLLINWYQSQVRQWIPRRKSNAKFYNEVQETLGCYESNIDQIHATLQKILIELQVMHVSHSSNTADTEANLFAPAESSHQPTMPVQSNLDRNHHHLKLSFPQFSVEESTRWIYKVEQYFKFKDIGSAHQV